MSLYSRFVLPPILNLVMKDKRLRERRERLVPKAHGTVLEVGIGSGLNLPYYDASRVRRLCAVDPSQELLAIARKKARRLGVDVELVPRSAERLPFPDASFDSAVLTWTLCSIPDPAAALAEIRRVLRPGGELFFIEHGLAPDPGVARWQRRLTPLWRPLAGGCHLDRRMDALVRAAFSAVEIETFYLEGPHLLTYMYEGTARA
jgi:ubiquinone/menaquinone biosynthesis C-methylase UbiE